MTDIISLNNGEDLGVFDTQTSRAGNILSTQIGALEYAPDLGIDLKYFLSEDFRFQNESFRSYLIQILANYGINVAEVNETINDLSSKYTFQLVPDETSTGLLTR